MEMNKEETWASPSEPTFDALLKTTNKKLCQKGKAYDLFTAEGQKQRLVQMIEDETTTGHERVRAMELLSELCGYRRDQRANDLERLDNAKLMDLLMNVAKPVLTRIGIRLRGKPEPEMVDALLSIVEPPEPSAESTPSTGASEAKSSDWDSRRIRGWGSYLEKDACICCFTRPWNYKRRRICVQCKRRLRRRFGGACASPATFPVPDAWNQPQT
jgi:hypothetical protein